MELAEKKRGTYVEGQHRKRRNTHAIFHNHDKQAAKNEQGLFPKRAQIKMGSHQGKNQHGHAGAYAAAFLRNFDGEAAQFEDEALAKKRNAG